MTERTDAFKKALEQAESQLKALDDMTPQQRSATVLSWVIDPVIAAADADRKAKAEAAELKRFREREPLVQALLVELTNDADGASWPSMEAVRDFKLTE